MSAVYHDEILKTLYSEACLDLEHATTKFWERVAYRHVFSDEQFVVCSQQPPARNSTRRVDLVVQTYRRGQPKETILFLEAKHATVSDSEVENVETEGTTAGYEYCEDSGQPYVWIVTCIGTSARFWVFVHNQGIIIPVYPQSADMTFKSLYIDFYQDKQVFKTLVSMRNHPRPPTDLVDELVQDWARQNAAKNASDQTMGLEVGARLPGPYNYPASTAQTYSTWAAQNTGVTGSTDADTEMAGPADLSIQEAGPSYSLTQNTEADPASAAQALDTGTTSTAQASEANSEYVHVKVHSDCHRFIFTGNKQRKYETVKKEWAEGRDKGGRKLWTYKGKKTTYYTYKLG